MGDDPLIAATDRSTPHRAGGADRAAAGFVLIALFVACAAFWVGVPLAGLWGISKLTDDFATHFVGGLIGVPVMMALFAPFLFWLNGLYLRITGVRARMEADAEAGFTPRVGGPLEPMLAASFVVAATALAIWFFFFAESAPTTII